MLEQCKYYLQHLLKCTRQYAAAAVVSKERKNRYTCIVCSKLVLRSSPNKIKLTFWYVSGNLWLWRKTAISYLFTFSTEFIFKTAVLHLNKRTNIEGSQKKAAQVLLFFFQFWLLVNSLFLELFKSTAHLVSLTIMDLNNLRSIAELIFIRHQASYQYP